MSFLEKLKKSIGIKIPTEDKTSQKQSIKKRVSKPKRKKIKVKSEGKKAIALPSEIQSGSEEQKRKPVCQSFAWQNLGGQEGQLVVDVYQTDEELVIQSAIAGVKPDDLDISIETDTILIKGNREKPEEHKGKRNYFYQECYWGLFSREIILPVEVDASQTKAVIKEGILTLRIPKIEREKKKKIAVKG